MKTASKITYFFVCLFILLTRSPAQQYNQLDAPVYVSKSGKKYHRIDCRTLRNSKQEIKLADAVKAGYLPCAVCSPVIITSASYGALLEESPLYRVNVEKLTSYKQADLKKMLAAKVIRHVDGDTVHISIENPPAGINKIEKLRMIGVDTPETVHPSKQVEYFGKEASGFTKNALLDKDVFIALDWDLRDKYGRMLAYIYTKDGKCHNAELIKQGFAHAYTRFAFQFLEEFRLLEREARSAKRGLWAD
ncbi:MAG: thermonuclease family protein [Spirochaetaceae bacterium]|jgi:micrococcal nuclease|nr:thermonuclease family protein [Spirochaetaceae bacterium]